MCIGEKHGKLTILGTVKKFNSKKGCNETWCHYRCDCGNEKDAKLTENRAASPYL